MRLPVSWLREFIPVVPAPEQIAERLSLAGLEVETIDRIRPAFSGVVVAKVLRVERHPNADRLTVCEVDAGPRGQFRVVCGAPNVRPGMMSALALVGARLAPPKSANRTDDELGAPVGAAVIRGVESQGMLCSERELGLSDDHSGIITLDDTASPGDDLATILFLDDHVLDVAVTPNRGDCLSILGLAREVAALFGLRLKRPRLRARLPHRSRGEVADRVQDDAPISVEISAPDLCPRYAALAMDGVTIGRSALWLRRRLMLCGMRPINNVVDVTNYVMLEMGQPLHAFDLDRLRDARIVVRRAGQDRELETLDHVRRMLDPDDLVIADGRGPVALAGVMGGLVSEASYRFERGVDPKGQVDALVRASVLMRELAGGREMGKLIDVDVRRFVEPEIEVSLERVEGLLGVKLSAAEVARRLKGLGINVKHKKGGRIIASIPSFRLDLREEADLVEEIARLNGFSDVPAVRCRPLREITVEDRRRQVTDTLRACLVGCGLFEVATLAFASAEQNRSFAGLAGSDAIRIINPLSTEFGELRRSLIPGLVATLRFNLNREAQACHVFEIGKVFYLEAGELKEAQRLGILSYGELALGKLGERRPQADFFTAKGMVETCLTSLGLANKVDFVRDPAHCVSWLHPGRQARLSLEADRLLGYIGELHPELASELDLDDRPVVVCELDLEQLIAYGSLRRNVVPPPRFPSVRRDLALVVDRDVPVGQVQKVVAQAGEGLMLESVELFDVYEGASLPAGKKSVALSCRYRAKDRTLTDAEVNQIHAQLAAQAVRQLGATLR